MSVKPGERFGRLEVLAVDGKTKWRNLTFKCRCDCGQIVEGVRGGDLRTGNTQSCGCLRDEISAVNAAALGRRSAKHGHGHPDRRTPTYNTWRGMRARCSDSMNASYSYYGARGIVVCERWQDFPNFLADMGERPEGKTLDRIDNDGDYEPENCRWATPLEQAQNQRPRVAA